jgi:hypothetical protein
MPARWSASPGGLRCSCAVAGAPRVITCRSRRVRTASALRHRYATHRPLVVPCPAQSLPPSISLRCATISRSHARARDRFVWAVVKANAYGHGLERALRAFEAADGLALLDLAEAERAREAGWRKPILLLEGFFEPSDIDRGRERAGRDAGHSLQTSRSTCSSRRGAAPMLDVHFKVNTGMNRLGFAGRRSRARLMRGSRHWPNVREVTFLMMHFANADRAAGVLGAVDVADQICGIRPNHSRAAGRTSAALANSAALFLRPEVQAATRCVRESRSTAPPPTKRTSAADVGRAAGNDADVETDRRAAASRQAMRSVTARVT